jgi:HEAT repeat protein
LRCKEFDMAATKAKSKIGELLEDEEFHALDQLVKLGKEAVPELNRILSRDNDVLRRQRAAIALGRIGDPAAEAELVKALKDKEAPVVLSCLDALVRLRATDAIKDVARLLKSSDVSVRHHAVKAIGGLGSDREIPILEKVIAEEESEYVRVQASKSLAVLQPR